MRRIPKFIFIKSFGYMTWDSVFHLADADEWFTENKQHLLLDATRNRVI